MDQRKTQFLQEKRKDQQEGQEYRRLAEQYALEELELERFKKLTQKDLRDMHDKTLADKQKVKQMEQQLDEVDFIQSICFFLYSLFFASMFLGRR